MKNNYKLKFYLLLLIMSCVEHNKKNATRDPFIHATKQDLDPKIQEDINHIENSFKEECNNYNNVSSNFYFRNIKNIYYSSQKNESEEKNYLKIGFEYLPKSKKMFNYTDKEQKILINFFCNNIIKPHIPDDITNWILKYSFFESNIENIFIERGNLFIMPKFSELSKEIKQLSDFKKTIEKYKIKERGDLDIYYISAESYFLSKLEKNNYMLFSNKENKPVICSKIGLALLLHYQINNKFVFFQYLYPIFKVYIKNNLIFQLTLDNLKQEKS